MKASVEASKHRDDAVKHQLTSLEEYSEQSARMLDAQSSVNSAINSTYDAADVFLDSEGAQPVGSQFAKVLRAFFVPSSQTFKWKPNRVFWKQFETSLGVWPIVRLCPC